MLILPKGGRKTFEHADEQRQRRNSYLRVKLMNSPFELVCFNGGVTLLLFGRALLAQETVSNDAVQQCRIFNYGHTYTVYPISSETRINNFVCKLYKKK